MYKNNKRREQQVIKVHKKGNNDDIVSIMILQIDQLHHQFRKLKCQHNSADTPGISVGVN